MIEYADERYWRWIDSIEQMNTIYEKEMEELEKQKKENEEKGENNNG